MLLLKIKTALIRYAFRVSCAFGDLRQEKRSNMNHDVIGNAVYAGLLTTLHNKKYYYHSTTGPSYSHLTDDGRKAMLELIELYAYTMLAAENEMLDERAKEIVMRELKA